MVVCDKASIYKCKEECPHALPHIMIIIDSKPCTVKGWCVPRSEQTRIRTQCIIYSGDK
jgi:hypothetical protein